MKNKDPELSDIHEAFARRLDEALTDANITGSTREKAEVLGISKSFMDALLKGGKLPARENSLRFAAICGVREEWLMEGTPPKTRAATPKLNISHWSKDDQELFLSMWESIEKKYNNPKE